MKKILLIIPFLFISMVLHAQWFYTSVQAATMSVTFVSGTKGFATTGFTIVRTTDGGVTWNSVAGASMDSIIMSLSFPSENVGYAAGLGGNILKTVDGGDTWTQLSCGTTSNFMSVFFIDENTGYVGGNNDALYKTTDGGQSWQKLNLAAGTIFSMYFTSPSFGIIANNSRSIYRTQDGGQHWLEIVLNSDNKYLGVHFADEMTGYACGMKDPLTPCMIKSTDGGLKWSEIPVTTGYGLQTVFFLDANTGYAAGVGGTMLKTTDGGATWGKQTTPDQGTIYSIFFTDGSHGFAGGAALIRTVNGGGPAGIFGLNGNSAAEIRPNPATGVVTLSSGMKNTMEILTIFSPDGKKKMEEHGTGTPFRIDVSGWPAGIYLVRIESGNRLFSGKLIRK
jgi:photosystem II stability/assembly factor-like uncharacterized protein